MNFSRARRANEGDKTAGRRTADDGVVYHDHALALENFTNRIVLDLDLGVAPGLRRLNERTADVVIANQGKLVGQMTFLGEA
jgi:hypothetical protein